MKQHRAKGRMGFRLVRVAILCGLSLAFLLPAGNVKAQATTKVGTSAAIFLRIPVGARASSLGSAFSSQADDASVLYWNTGGISRLSGCHFIFDYSDWLPGLNFGFIGATLPIGGTLTMGAVATHLSTEEMEITTPDAPMGTGQTYDAASTSIGAALSSRLTDKFSIGGTIKIIQERIYNTSSTGLAFDVGTLFDTPFWGVRLGVSISNVGTKLQMRGEDLNVRVDIDPSQSGNNETIVGELKTDSFDPPMILRIGLSDEAFRTDHFRLTWMIDGVNPNDNAPSVNLGLEFGLFRDIIQLRCGYNDLFLEDSIRGFTVGTGIRMQTGTRGLTFDYAYQSFKYLGGVNRFTLNLVI
ncbi:MAG: PorV/PorQ family protein [bacterium]